MPKVKGAKEKGVKYNLVYRSSRDASHEGENAPSEMVLVPAVSGNKSASRSQSRKQDASSDNNPFLQTIKQQKEGSVRNHVNELGLPNDGYDYSQHLRSMGQGKFIGADGKERAIPEVLKKSSGGNGLEIPEELLPSQRELDRQQQHL